MKIVQNLSLVFVSLLLCFGMVEGFLRITSYSPLVLIPPYLFDNHPNIGWTLRPNFTATIDTPEGPVTYSINSQSIRAPYDFSKNHNSSIRRIFIIGDSLTFGTSVNEEDTFPRLLNNRMRSKNLPVEFINLGVPGFGTIHSYKRLLEFSGFLGLPDAVIYMFTPNDPVDNILVEREVVNGVRLDSHRKNKILLSYVAKAYNEIRSLALVIDFYYRYFGNPRSLKRRELIKENINVEDREDFILTTKYLSKMALWADQKKVKFLVIMTSHSRYSEPLKNMFGRIILIIDAEDMFSELNVNNEPIILFDGVHWNKHGHKLVAEGIEELLLKHGFMH